MKRLMIAASVLAASAAFTANAESYKPDLDTLQNKFGATIKMNGKCWANVDSSRGFGFWDTCDGTVPYARAISSRGQRDTLADGGGAGGGGGGGGGR